MDSTTHGIIPWHRSHLVQEGGNLLSHPWIRKACDLSSTRQLLLTHCLLNIDRKTWWPVPGESAYSLCWMIWARRLCRSAFLNLSSPLWFFLVQIHALCMDNVGNCNTTAYNLGAMLPCFHGMVSRMRCFPHILNLVAKVSHESHCLQHVLMHVF